MSGQLTVLRTGSVLATETREASTAAARLKGLLSHRELDPSVALVLAPARQVHTVGMRFAIDVVFCDHEWRVVHVVRSMRPNRVTKWVRSARYAVELAAGCATGVEVGDQLSPSPR